MSADGKYVFWFKIMLILRKSKKLVEQIYKLEVVNTHVINTRPKPTL